MLGLKLRDSVTDKTNTINTGLNEVQAFKAPIPEELVSLCNGHDPKVEAPLHEQLDTISEYNNSAETENCV